MFNLNILFFNFWNFFFFWGEYYVSDVSIPSASSRKNDQNCKKEIQDIELKLKFDNKKEPKSQIFPFIN